MKLHRKNYSKAQCSFNCVCEYFLSLARFGLFYIYRLELEMKAIFSMLFVLLNPSCQTGFQMPEFHVGITDFAEQPCRVSKFTAS